MNNIDYSNAIKQMMQSLVEAFGRKDKSDKTFTTRVIVVHGIKCKVLHSGNTYTVSSLTPCSVGDMVRVCAPCNNWQGLFAVKNKTGNNL